MTRDELIGKVRKILSRTEENGCTEAEAETAFALAGRLMAEHQLEMADMTAAGGPEPEGFTTEKVAEYLGRRWKSERSYAAAICRDFFGVHCYYSTFGSVSRQYFFGTPTQIEAAKWVYEGLLAAFDRLWAAHRQKTGAPGRDRLAYVLGVSHGFRARLREERRAMEAEHDRGRSGPGTALVLANADLARQSAFEAAHPSMRTSVAYSPTGSRASYEAGKSAGRSLNLSRPLGGSGRKGLPC